MKIKKFRIITNIIAYGLEPVPSDEVEQHLTVSENGRIWFNAYQYGNGNYLRSRSRQLYIGTEAASDILHKVWSWATKDYRDRLVTDVGYWKVTLFESADFELNAYGNVVERPMVNGQSLSDILRRKIPIDNLFLFDGGVDSSHNPAIGEKENA